MRPFGVTNERCLLQRLDMQRLTDLWFFSMLTQHYYICINGKNTSV